MYDLVEYDLLAQTCLYHMRRSMYDLVEYDLLAQTCLYHILVAL